MHPSHGATPTGTCQIDLAQGEASLVLEGSWRLAQVATLSSALSDKTQGLTQVRVVDGSALSGLDTAGALTFWSALRHAGVDAQQVALRGFDPRHARIAELVREREALVSATSSTTSGCGMAAASAGGASSSSSGSSRAALAAAAAADAADIEEQNKRRRLMLEEKRRALMDKPGQAQRPTATKSDARPSTNVEDDGDDDEGGGGSGGAAVLAAREKLKAAGRKRRPGMF
jgi:anti-anti-sigma regulatory factor